MSDAPPEGTRAPDAAAVKARALRGTLTTFVGQAGMQGLHLVSNLILARLLFPEAFGMMAIVWLVVQALTMLSDVGIRSAVVRDDRGDDQRFLDTAWTLQVLRGLLLWVAAAAVALPVAGFYGEPMLARLLPVAALTAVLAGFESTRIHTLSRQIALGRLVAIELLAQVAALVGTVGYALLHRSVWALVAGGLAARATHLVLSHVALPGAGNRFAWDRDAARRIVSFGKWILVSTMITFLATRLDIVLLGKLLPLGALGVYSIGTMIAQVPNLLAARVARAVLLPVLAAARREAHALLASDFARTRALCLPAGLLAALGAIMLSPAFVHYLYDSRYHDAAWIAQLSMLPVWFAFLQFMARSALEALGNSRALASGNAVKLVATAAGCLLGFRWGGLPGLIVGVGAGALCGYSTIAASLRAAGISTLRGDLLWTTAGLAAGIAIGWLPHRLSELGGPGVAVLTLGCGLPVVLPLGLWVLSTLRGSLRGDPA